MRVCLISREYPPDTGWGGIATFAYHLAHGLVALGHEVEVISLSKDGNKASVQDGIMVHRVLQYNFPGNLDIINMCMPFSRYVLMASTSLWAKFLDLHKEKAFDVVDTPELLAEGLYPAVTKVAPLVTRLYTPHSKFIANRLHNVTPSFDHEFVALLERLAMRNADILTSPSEDLADYISQDLHIDRQTIRIVRNPIDCQKFSPAGLQALPADSRPTILFVGRLEERKGPNYLIAAIPAVIQAIPDVRFVIIGDDTKTGPGHTSVLAQLKSSLQQSACQKHVTFIDRVPLEDLPSYYRSADICVVPSVYDNSPYTCLEAMSCGRAVIGTNCGGIPEYMTDGESGILVPPRNPDELAKAIISLLSDPQERYRLGKNARQHVLDKFQPTEIARQTVELYREAIERYALHPRTQLYRKPAEQVLADAEELLYAFNYSLGDFMDAHSWRCRLRRWLNLPKRPRLYMAKLLVFGSKVLLKLTGKKQLPARVTQLQAEIELRENPLRFRELLKTGEKN